MNYSSEEIDTLRSNAQVLLNKCTQLQQAIAQLEATLSREENQKVSETSKKCSVSCIKKFQTHNSYLRIEKNTYK